ncbi:MAG: flagellar biosynthesis regulator FlaF [Rhodospirillaceae bacterium]|nr:flagellar biosynthesis regulator FlaF [Rhodospirillaceae bacterium]MBL6931153.1 flagellar biosynthesis regulator FlaF [Rhodospirillales bacterium]
MQSRGYQTYATAQHTTIGVRELERRAMARAIHELSVVRDNYTPGKEGYALYTDALKFNQKLWTLIQSNIVDNPTDGTAELRANFLELSLFVDRHTLQALRDPNPESLTALIDINKKISGGLFSNDSKTEQTTAPAPAMAPMPSGF